MDAIEGHTGVGRSGGGTGEVEQDKVEKVGQRDHLASLLDLVRKHSGSAQDWTAEEFDGIRSELDFRRAMALEEERLRGSWSQRTLRLLGMMGANLWNSRALRLLR